jgi:dihydrofolate reductase
LNIILTTQKNSPSNNDFLAFASDKEHALEIAANIGAKEVFVAGGAQIYQLFFPLASRIYMTRVHASFEADTFFPEIDTAIWEMVQQKEFNADEKHAYSFSIQCWERK